MNHLTPPPTSAVQLRRLASITVASFAVLLSINIANAPQVM
ncbi:MAG: hypothetical protein ACJAVR_003613 [Paracoccaceae bacterium]|jgi:hypothetical protein